MSMWQDISTAPKTGDRLLLWIPRLHRAAQGEAVFGSWRVDQGFSGNEEPLWLDESYDDYSCGYASTPLQPTHWQPEPGAPA